MSNGAFRIASAAIGAISISGRSWGDPKKEGKTVHFPGQFSGGTSVFFENELLLERQIHLPERFPEKWTFQTFLKNNFDRKRRDF